MAKSKSTRTDAAANKSEEIVNKLLQAKSILQCVAGALEIGRTPFQVDEPSWALGAAVDLIQEALGYPEVEDGEAWHPVCYANAIADTVLAAHDTRDSHCRNLDLHFVLHGAVAEIDRAVDILQRLPAPKPRGKKPTLRVVPNSAPVEREVAS
jgi:hypothetical protein